MTDQRELIKAQRARHEERLRGLKSYVTELTEMAARHGTDQALVDDDLTKAKADLEFHECQIGDCAAALGHDPAAHRTFQVYKDAAGEWRWRLVAGNKEIIASGEGYQKKHDCLHAIELVKDSKDARVEAGD